MFGTLSKQTQLTEPQVMMFVVLVQKMRCKVRRRTLVQKMPNSVAIGRDGGTTVKSVPIGSRILKRNGYLTRVAYAQIIFSDSEHTRVQLLPKHSNITQNNYSI